MAIDNLTCGGGDASYPVVCNNACWFLGEVAALSNNKDIIKPFLAQIGGKLSALFQNQKLNKSLAMNIAIAFGRLGLVDPKETALNYLELVTK
jgi:hypothetical protein